MSKIGGRRPVSLSGVLPLFPFNLISSLHISLICWGETQVPLQACAIICSFWGRAPEVLHSVRTCNVDSISAAIRPHLLYQTCLSVISPPPPPSSHPLSLYTSLFIPHTWLYYPHPLCFSSTIPPLMLSFLLAPLPICPIQVPHSLPISTTHLTTPAFSPPPLYPLHSTPIPSPVLPQGSPANCLFNNRPP